jgi:uridine kinase
MNESHCVFAILISDTLSCISIVMNTIPVLIGVAGGPCSGKSTVCQKIVDDLQTTAGPEQANRVTVIPMENFYKHTTPEERSMAQRGCLNLDHPDAFDDELLLRTLKDLVSGKTVKVKDAQEKRPFERDDYLDCTV